MKKYVLSVIAFGLLLAAKAQSKTYKEYEACASWAVYKGKKNHGQKYCNGWAMVREYKDGRKDTTGFWSDVTMYSGDEYEKYKNLSERGKYIADSLKEDGIPYLQQSYLTYEPVYMKAGKKTERLWSIEGADVVIYDYLFWKGKNEHGIQLLKKSTITAP